MNSARKQADDGSRHIRVLEKMKHALDGSYPDEKWHRNFYCTNPYDQDMNYLVTVGLMQKGNILPNGLQYFHVTKLGKEFVRQYKRDIYAQTIS